MTDPVYPYLLTGFVDILNEMRTGRLTPASIELFRSLSRPLPESKIQAAELYPLRRDVETSNISRLNALNGDAREFAARDTGDSKKVESCIAPKQLRLKPGAQVMLLKNLDSSLVNGSLGVVAGFAGSGRFTTKKAIRQCLMQNRNRMSGEDTTEDDINTILDLKLPIVEFTNGREIAIEMDSWSIELPGIPPSKKKKKKVTIVLSSLSLSLSVCLCVCVC
ncbi:hypothetical protein DM01DRAFT_1157901 [Hesseltinella vesiculosa]|uniref:DNA helicase Pif1-like 2B domain-containing protein n=1 Tax=Hesseltinella vesiculosa TaxID=101127 RepID=A0A1X2GSB7_9FUNG|nr:hypothetical protein DM01DRAFT_1157901 [Hesseltinella vesiculosa]